MCMLAQYTIYIGLSSAERCGCSYIHCASERQTFLSQYNVEGLLVTELLFYHQRIQRGNLGQEEERTTLQSPSHTHGTTSTLYSGSELPSLFLPSLFLPLPSLPPLPPPPPYSLLLPLPLFLLPNTKVYSNTSYCTAHSLLQSLEGRLTHSSQPLTKPGGKANTKPQWHWRLDGQNTPPRFECSRQPPHTY